ncbi:6-carboxytetrahydropterin synthase QueD [Polynucleobacter sp. 30F-ANTBAC]|uniref:6-carboxytetrahydropterin synthase QueD n=1 Tax=Polynucleobacter sp. 30F-ANTBAC TaxID=2689095 RepID=UPI001C0B929E|nr:6-carboxytetrahydropterin synthase QueD [Polynucleobacter sp. 30F-ANTBAC]MBU3599116.1 6-carboxytetrahydropterin synthase QueD [Polynucleobacter sp. 30F-ANTBAC]
MNKKTEITRRLEFDAGHRIPHHGGHCRHIHGHRYVIEVTVLGDVLSHQGHGDDGMVLDFGDIKKIANELIVEQWDHAFLVAKEDEMLVNFLASIPGHKTVVLDCIPTVENLAQTAFKILDPVFKERFNGRLNLSRLRIYETPNCWADIHA